MVNTGVDKRIITIDGLELEYVVAGAGRPPVILLSGYGVELDASWRTIFDPLAEITTVFAYNRFNYGHSARTDAPQTGTRVVTALRRLLTETNLAPPYVLVAHSLGGIYAQLFARRNPDEVSGMVLIDSSHPDQEEQRRRGEKGFMRVVNKLILRLDAAINRRHCEFITFEETAREINNGPAFPNIPLIVVSAGKPPPAWLITDEFAELLRENQRRLAALSPQGRQIVAEGCGHFVQRCDPKIVIDAIGEVVEQARNQTDRPHTRSIADADITERQPA